MVRTERMVTPAAKLAGSLAAAALALSLSAFASETAWAAEAEDAGLAESPVVQVAVQADAAAQSDEGAVAGEAPAADTENGAATDLTAGDPAGTQVAAEDGEPALESSADDAETPATPDVPAVPETPVAQGPLADGLYSIQSLVGDASVLDVAGGSRSSGGNVQIYGSNRTDAQKWQLTYSDGYYTIKSEASGLVLDVSGASTADGANVQQYAGNGTAAQKWALEAVGDGTFRIVSALDRNKVIDVSGGSAADGTNVHIWTSNGTNAQKWYFAFLGGIRGEQLIEDGVYTVASALGGGVIDISGGSYADATNIQVYTSNNTNAQRWAFVWDEAAEAYAILNAANGKALDVYNGNPAPGANVTQFTSNGTPAQRWVLQKSGSHYTIASTVSGMVLDVQYGSRAAGANIQTYRPNGTNAQKWTLTKTDGAIAEGLYTIYSMLAADKQVIDVPGGSKAAGTQLQTYQANSSFAQKFRATHVSGDTYTLQNINSGLFLTSSNGKLVQNAASKGDDQKWSITFSGAGLRIASVADATKSAAVSSSSASNGKALVIANTQQTKQQLWRFQVVNLIEDGYYIIHNANSNKVLDVAGGSYLPSANIATYGANGTGAQVFYIANQGGGAYSIMNAKSRKVLDVTWGSKDNGANVQQYYWNGSAAQLWIAELADDCSLVFKNKNSGKVLEVAGGSKSDGANVQQYTANGSAAQGWVLEATGAWSLTGNAELDDYVASIVESNGGDLRRCFDWMGTLGHVQSLDSNFHYGIMGNDVVNHYALLVKRNGAADCYGDASLFCLIARAIGYDANFRGGSCASASRGWVPHGWTEVYIGGTTYVCDVNLRRDLPGYNWYMVTYDSAPTGYLL